MENRLKSISQNIPVSELSEAKALLKNDGRVVNLPNFVDQKANAKSHIQDLIRHIAKEVNRHKLTYPQLKYVFRVVRGRCNVEVPVEGKRKLYELPTSEELNRFHVIIENPLHRLIFETLENTGLRVAELCNLRVDRIDLKTNLVFVSQGKGGKDRSGFHRSDPLDFTYLTPTS